MEQIAIAIVMMIASMLISAALAPKAVPPKPAAFDEFDFPQVDEGTPQCVIFGDCWSPDWTVLGVGNYRTAPVYSNQVSK